MPNCNLPPELSAWVEVDTNAILHNLKRIKAIITPDTKILAVVKANAYGLGQNEIAHVLKDAGVDCFGVTSLTEAVGLRRGGIESPIVLFAPLLPEQVSTALEYGLTMSISSISQLQEAQKQASTRQEKIKIHIKVETGMGRTGLWAAEIPDFIRILKGCTNVEPEGIYSHLARAGSDKVFSEYQFTKFKEAIGIFQSKGIDFPVKHIVNSAGLLNYPHMHLDMVRIGTLLFGQVPMGATASNIKEPWKAKTKIINLRRVPANQPIGYGSEFTTKRDSEIGIIPVGLADGYNVSPKIRAKGLWDLVKVIVKEILAYYGKGPNALGVEHNMKIYPVVGRIGMQLTMIDFTGGNVKEGDTITFSLRRINAPLHIPRVYLRDGQPYKITFSENADKYLTVVNTNKSELQKGEML